LSYALLIAGAASPLPRLIALAAAVATSAAVPAGLLIRLARSAHLRGRNGSGAGLLGASLLVTGATVVGAVVTGPDPATRPLVDAFAARLGAAGLSLATLLFLLGLLLLPGTASGPLARLHRALDGLAVAVCFLYAARLMVVPSRGGVHSLTAGVALLGCAALAIATVIGLRAVRHRPAVLTCCAGAALAIAGLGTTVALFDGTVPAGWLPLVALAVVFGPVLCWAGALAGGSGADPAPALAARTDPGFAGYPILAVPVGTALAATGYRMVGARPFDAVSVALGLGVLIVLAVREFLTVLDIRRYTRGIAAQEARFRSLVSGSADITVVLDTDLVVTWQSPSAAHQFGLRDQDVLDHPFIALIHPEDAAAVRERLASVLTARQRGEASPALLTARLRDGAGRWRETESTLSDQRGVPEVGALVVHVRDVGERREQERMMHRSAFTDQLTGLANRRQLLRTIGAMRAVPGQPGALLMINVDGLIQAGTGRGREVGDAVFIEVARRLRETVEASDRPARVSGNEFAVATADHPVRAYALASRLLTELIRPYPVAGAIVHVSVAVGLAELAAASSVGDTLSRAGLAVQRARQLRQGRIEWYDEALEAALLRRFTLEEELPGVVARGELDLVFQPIVDLIDEVPVGAEALLRWRHPKRGTVPAADFVTVADDLGLIDEIGEWVLHHACRQLASWLRDGLDLWLSVNLTARQLAAPHLVARVARVLADHEVPAERLVLEVTEQGLGPDLQGAVAQLTGLRALGVRTALAKFGTGPTPLASLRRLPVDVLKVDRALFAESVRRTGAGTPIIDVVVGLGRRLGLEIVAEGLEDEAHLDLVRAGGCRYGQGFLLGRPQPAERFEAYVDSHRSPTA
jgi:diguanylate cyclase (GGDEF)-like protein/PAS domain S-box-containing protein